MTKLFLKRAYDKVGPDGRWPEFEKRYAEELKNNPAFPALKKTVDEHGTVTLLYSSHDSMRNNAVVVGKLLT